MDSDVPLFFASVHDLRSWLASRDIPVDRWGTGQAKRVEDLWSELGSGESVLTEVAQLLATGGTAYPGLVTRYQMTQVEMAIPDLPDTAFSTAESGRSQDATVKLHYWDWRTNTF
jgi:hypothetical protein